MDLSKRYCNLHLGLDMTCSGRVEDSAHPCVPSALRTGIGVRVSRSRIEVSEGADGAHHIELNGVGTTSIGKVGQVFPKRDSAMLAFPCFKVTQHLVMVSGLVIDEASALCGLVCAGYHLADPNAMPLSYAATL
jgi:hypothetical protein